MKKHPAESERWIQEHLRAVVIIKITFSHYCTTNAKGSRMYMPIHLNIINMFKKISSCSHLNSVLRMTMKKRAYDSKMLI